MSDPEQEVFLERLETAHGQGREEGYREGWNDGVDAVLKLLSSRSYDMNWLMLEQIRALKSRP